MLVTDVAKFDGGVWEIVICEIVIENALEFMTKLLASKLVEKMYLTI